MRTGQAVSGGRYDVPVARADASPAGRLDSAASPSSCARVPVTAPCRSRSRSRSPLGTRFQRTRFTSAR